ncbi:MAG: hypothetical protein LBG75_03560 [Candidatus Nomurabacteria bacterium]|nr:hypothetical protein [Candidatus Nomurabacteria bacterium]
MSLMNQGGRFYHTTRHIGHMKDELRKSGFWGSRSRHPILAPLANDANDALMIAIYYHDVVYGPGASDNEERSAELMEANFSYMSNTVLRHAVKLIMATRHNEKPKTVSEKLMADLDLTILGQSERRFNIYEMQLREEYLAAGIDASDYCAGRVMFLEGMLRRRSIYFTEYFAKKYESRARANMRGLVGRLVGSQ